MPRATQPKIDRATAVATLWSRGALHWKLRPEQARLKDLIDSSGRELVVPNIARKIGKTTTCVVYSLEQAIRSKKHIRYATAFLTDLQEFLCPIFDLILDDCPPHLLPVFHQGKKEYRFNNGSVIKLVGLDKNRNGLRGNIIDILIIDEAAFVTNLEYLYSSVIIPATKNRPFKLVFPSTPPESPEHFWAKELVPKAQQRNTYIEMTLDADTSLDPEERKRLLDEVGGEQSQTAQREYFCKIIVDATKALAPEFNDSHVKEITKPELAYYYMAGDLGGKNDRCCVHLFCWDFKRAKLLVLDEREFAPEASSAQIVPALKEMEQGYGVKARWIDTPGSTAMDWMKDYQFPTILPQKDNKEASANQVRLALTKNEIEIDPKCKLLITTLRSGTWNNTRSDWARTQTLGHMDAFDSLIYGLRHVNKANPYPLLYNASPYTHHVPTNSSQTKSHQALKSLFVR